MENRKKIMNIRKSHFDAVRFFGDFSTNSYLMEDNNILPEVLMKENCDILYELYNGDCVDSRDVGKMINIYERIQQGRREPINMDDVETVIRIRNRDGEMIFCSVLVYLEVNDAGLIERYVGVIKPLRKKEIEYREILESFSNDKNPAIYINRIAKFTKANPDRDYAFIQFDIRKFRYINEKYGCDVGDEILTYINDTLKIMCDENHLFCRLTSDIFQVVTYYNDRQEILDFIEMLDARLHRYKDIRFNMSYGISIAPGTSTTYRLHGDEAGLARMESKRTVTKRAVFYEDTLMKSVKESGAIEEREEDALANGEFHVYLQPKYEYDKMHAKIVGAEALVRWIDRDGRIKSPMTFVPVFEKNGFILKLDQYMWESVCKILRGWLEAGKNVVPISVNVSRTYLDKVDVVGYIRSLVDKYEIPIELLQIEITETTESEETLSYVRAFKDNGFTLMMDDFGSGYSSLNTLKDTPFDVLKIDRSFLNECMDNQNGKIVVSHVIAMSGDLGMDIIAEGVETKDMADFLYDNGCKISQGYYFSKPIPVEEFEKLVFGED
ncbi:MAG: EAL domain-containing protein [Wujia sp.]